MSWPTTSCASVPREPDMPSQATYHVRRPESLQGTIQVPGDKSISHRALLLNSIANGTAKIEDLLLSADCLSTLSCLQGLGIGIELGKDNVAAGHAVVHGQGLLGLREPEDVLDAGNSGTSIRLLSGLAAAQPFLTILTGDASLRNRPMARVIEPLRTMGAHIEARGGGRFAPIAIRGGDLHPLSYQLPVASAQVKSALLLAGLFVPVTSRLGGLVKSRDHTERLLAAMGAAIQCSDEEILITGGQELKAVDISVPGDISSAAYWMVAGAVHQQAGLRLLGTGINPTRTGIIDVLQSMGCRLQITNERATGGEPVADIAVESSALKGAMVDGEIIPRLIDEIPVLAVAACTAGGETTIRDAAELRVKESDRISLLCRELTAMGAAVEELPDGLIIHGPCRLKGTVVDSHGDHRLAMALAVAGLIADGETTIKHATSVEISYPGFWADLERVSGNALYK